MKVRKAVIWLLSGWAIVTIPSSRAFAEDEAPRANVTASAQTDVTTTINLKNPDWQVVLDNLFGTPDSGLLDGSGAFHFRAEDLTLTSTQAEFFTAIDSPLSLSALIEAAEAVRGNIRLEGTIDGLPFELKLAGRELKIEGLTLTEAQREALVAELSAIPGLKEMKIQALVDGRMTVTKYQGGHEKLEIRDRGRPEHPAKPEKVEHHGRDVRVERLDRIEKPERPERPERGGPGRH
jgi:hypothetical protein